MLNAIYMATRILFSGNTDSFNWDKTYTADMRVRYFLFFHSRTSAKDKSFESV